MKQVVFNFKDRFVRALEAGEKTSTIRLFLKTEPPKIGDRLKLFKGMRTKNCRLINEVICQDCCPIVVCWDGIVLNGRVLNPGEANAFAYCDGFTSFADMRAFFAPRFPLPGKPHWISWSHHL